MDDFNCLLLPHIAAKKDFPQISEEDAQDPVKAGEKHLQHVYALAWEGVEEETEPIKKARMKCMLHFMELGADDRILMPTYLWMFEKADEIKDPDSEMVQKSCIYKAREELFKLMDKVDEGKLEAYTAVSTIHDGIHNSYSKARLSEAKTNVGGGSALSKAHKYYHDWIAERQKNDKSVYSAWSDKCNSLDSDFVKKISADRSSEDEDESIGEDEEEEEEE